MFYFFSNNKLEFMADSFEEAKRVGVLDNGHLYVSKWGVWYESINGYWDVCPNPPDNLKALLLILQG